MPILSSQIVSSTLQQDGGYSVVEQHTDHTGRTYPVAYTAPAGMDIYAVLAERAERLGAEIDARAAVVAEASQFEIPLTKLQFRQRFTPAERIMIDAFNASFESSELLTAEQKATLRTLLEDFRAAEDIRLSDNGTILGVQMYEQMGLIAAGRAAEVLA